MNGRLPRSLPRLDHAAVPFDLAQQRGREILHAGFGDLRVLDVHGNEIRAAGEGLQPGIAHLGKAQLKDREVLAILGEIQGSGRG